MSKPTASQQPVVPPTSREQLGSGPRPGDLIAHSAWNEALERLVALVNAGPALIALLGAPGTGKTVLLRHLAAILRERDRAVCLLYSGDSSVDVGPAEILLIDEADQISDARLEEYCSRRDVAVVFAALPASRKRFERYPDISLIRLPRLTAEEACKFVAARLAQLGLPEECLTDAAWARLIAHGRGVPRLLLGVLGHALFVAGEEHAACVTGPHVEEAIEARGGSPEPISVELAPTQSDFAQEHLPAVVPGPENASTKTRLESTREATYAARVMAGLYLAMVVAFLSSMYAVPIAAWLTWSMYRHRDNVAAPGLGAPAVVVAQISPAMHAGTEQMGGVAGAVNGPGAPLAEAGSTGHGTTGVEKSVQRSSPAPVSLATGPDGDALAVAVPSAPAGNVSALPSPPLGPMLAEPSPSAPDRGATSTDASGIGQRSASAGNLERSDLEAKSEPGTRQAAAPAPEEHRMQMQSQELLHRFARPSGQGTGVHVQVAQNPHPEVPTVGRQARPPGPFRRAALMQHSTRPVQQLLLARQALVRSNSSAARGLLEAAETAIVFAAGAAPRRDGIAVGQITNALSLLNSGSTTGALPYLDRAIIALQPTS